MKNNKQYDKTTKLHKQNIKKSYWILYTTTIIFLIIVGCINFFVFKETVADIAKGLITDLFGILIAFLIFDIFNEKLTRDSYSEDISSNILNTLLGHPEIFETFNQEQRNKYILANVTASIQDDDVAEMVSNQCLEYLTKKNFDKIKTEFDYKIEIFDSLPKKFNNFSNSDEYLYLQESLSYNVRHLTSKTPFCNNSLYIGLVFNNKILDDIFRDTTNDELLKQCVFRENLDLKKEDVEKIISLDNESLISLCEEMFKFKVQVNQKKGQLSMASASTSGILLKFDFDEIDNTSLQYNIRLFFHIPKIQHTILQVVFSDPTKAPNVSVSYPEETMVVEMFPFLSKGTESSYELAHEVENGIYDISLTEEWIYPISGIAFTLTKE